MKVGEIRIERFRKMIARRKGMDMRTLEKKVRLIEIVSVLSNGKESIVGYIEEDVLEGFIWTNDIRGQKLRN